jgi:hypothetical protein
MSNDKPRLVPVPEPHATYLLEHLGDLGVPWVMKFRGTVYADADEYNVWRALVAGLHFTSGEKG